MTGISWAGRRDEARSARRASRKAFRPGAEALEERRLFAAGDVLTYHNDNARTGQNLAETILAPANVNPTSFGKVASYPLDGAVYAQPLYEANVPFGKSFINVVFVATTNDSVYAFNANSTDPQTALLWHTSFLNPAAGVTTASGADLGVAGSFDKLGIVGTPVIDSSTGTLYVADLLKITSGGTSRIVEQLNALDITTGAEKFGAPVNIEATVPGTGEGSNTVTFNPQKELQRSGLLLLNGVVYVGFTSFNLQLPYHGWLIGYNASNLEQVAVFNTTPNSVQGGIWMAGGAPASDGSSIFVATGNGPFDADVGGLEYGDSFLRLTTGLQVADYFTPSDQAYLADKDEDLGSGGVVVLPSQVGGSAPLLVGAGKEGAIYLVNRNNLGQFDPNANHVVQNTSQRFLGVVNGGDGEWLGGFGTPAYFNNTLYYGSPGRPLQAFRIANGQIDFTPTSRSATNYAYPGATPSVSASGTANGIVWTLEKGNPAVLHAYNAANLAVELYNSNMAGPRDQLGGGVTFAVPTVAGGKVFVGTQNSLTIFGELNPGPVALPPTRAVRGRQPRVVPKVVPKSRQLIVRHPQHLLVRRPRLR